ncbi:MAG TPA: ATP-binding cassette domain-containing protein [Candidatus Paceibacterota bacterium]|nr:ATP-binding cassette domain-containing protein [Candidatus Paceibacterota bacterium]
MDNEGTKLIIDPVCGMNIAEFSDSPSLGRGKQKRYFCGKFCVQRYKKDPARYEQEPLMRLHDVWKIFDTGTIRTEVLKGLHLHIWEGDFTVIVGPSGSGKSTTLNMVGLLDRPTSGRIFLKGKDITDLDDDKRAQLRSLTFGFVFQQYNLIPWLTAEENALLPLVFSTTPPNEKMLAHFFGEMVLKDRMEHRPTELSGGEQQRIALLRALANDPAILLGDEPTGNLDSVTGGKILEILIDLHKVHKKTLLIVTHDLNIAKKADQVISFKDGRLVRNGTVHEKLR